MVRILKSTSAKVIVASGSAVALFAGGMAWAGDPVAPVKASGGSQVQTKVVSDVDFVSISNLNSWVNLPGAKVQVSVPQGTQRLLTAHFSAETSCSAEGEIFIGGWCSTRIVARKVSGASTIQMHPQAATDFAIDSGGEDAWEGHAMDRHLTVGAGTWEVWVQGQIEGTSGSLSLDDWYLEVEVNK